MDLDTMAIVGSKPPWKLLCPEMAGKEFASDDFTRTLPRLSGRTEKFLPLMGSRMELFVAEIF
jgi:hypothetical protein